MSGWVRLDDEALHDFLAGELAPVKSRSADGGGIEVWMPHDMQTGRFTGARTCARCGLLPLDYDAIETECAE